MGENTDTALDSVPNGFFASTPALPERSADRLRARNVFESHEYNGPKASKEMLKITTIETHTAGEPLRIIVDGLPTLPPGTCLEKRQFFMDNYDDIRSALLKEPRGHADQYGAVVTLPQQHQQPNVEDGQRIDEADVDIFFLNTKGYSPMCGHGTIAITKVLAEMGLGHTIKEGRSPSLSSSDDNETTSPTIRQIIINSPAGKLLAHATLSPSTGLVTSTSFINVASFVYLRDASVEVPNLGNIGFDIAFGGAFYAIIELSSLPAGAGLHPRPVSSSSSSSSSPSSSSSSAIITTSTNPHPIPINASSYATLITLGRQIKTAITSKFSIKHPYSSTLSTLFGTIFVGPATNSSNSHQHHHSRNVNIYEDGIVDRSPCGTGVSARAALLHARGELGVGEKVTMESVIGSTMTVEIKETTTFGSFDAVVAEVGAQAFATGRAEWWIDRDDRIGEGFVLR